MRKKKHGEKSVIRSMRVSVSLDKFLRSIPTFKGITANEFIIDKLVNTPEYENYLIKQDRENNYPRLDL